jgi:hypothetical protein
VSLELVSRSSGGLHDEPRRSGERHGRGGGLERQALEGGLERRSAGPGHSARLQHHRHRHGFTATIISVSPHPTSNALRSLESITALVGREITHSLSQERVKAYPAAGESR